MRTSTAMTLLAAWMGLTSMVMADEPVAINVDRFHKLNRNALPANGKPRLRQRSEIPLDRTPGPIPKGSKLLKCLKFPELGTSPGQSHAVDLYSNSVDMLALSAYIYEIVGLRFFAKLDNNTDLLAELSGSPRWPKGFSDIQQTLERHLETLGKDKNVDDAKDLLRSFLADSCDGIDQGLVKEAVNGERQLVHMDDGDQTVASSRVHAIVVNERKKRIEIVFRGTTNTTPRNAWADWSTNANAVCMRTIPNPVKDLAKVLPKIKLHRGFAKALLGPARRDFQMDTRFHPKDVTTPFGEIICKIKALWKDGYSLYVTGHSLGGATATLFGFLASATVEEFSKTAPVTLYTFASPRVGGQKFRKAFKYLEEQGRLRLARVYCQNDKVPLLPYMFGMYRHTGMEFRLRNAEPILVDYPVYHGWTQGRVNIFQRLRTLPALLTFHSCTEMLDRLRLSRSVLRETTLEEEYAKMWGYA